MAASGDVSKEELVERILQHLDKTEGIPNTLEYCQKNGLDHKNFVGAMKSLQSLQYINCVQHKYEGWKLTGDGEAALKNGSPEFLVVRHIPKEGTTQKDLEKVLDKKVVKLGWSQAMMKKMISFDKKSKLATANVDIESEVDTTRKILGVILNEFPPGQILTGQVSSLSKGDIDMLKKRKFISVYFETFFEVTKGSNFSLKVEKPQADLTTNMLLSGEWETANMKQYNLNALGTALPCGYLHPLLKVRTEYRQIFLEMGFQEMQTNQYVESSFWNFDSLFQPQQHPARDAHDTFFLKDPEFSEKLPMDYLERVKNMHESGGEGSIGWRYDWSETESRKNILRTHTTSVTSRTLYKLAQSGFKPGKYFSIDRVYRNETLDATHLAEFHQVEGFVVDKGLTLGNLIGVIRQFFNYLGIEKIKFKPAYNPYTEPSMEVFSYHEGLKKWVEVGNSGIFRPEMLRPMGLPEDVVVIAWGLSLERPTMIKYNISNIRELVGHKLDLNFVENHAIVRLDK
mmetsp:Transcript_14676/g.41749  ORF Transcript_14676/g.41749 Transcript_14676/m.41749 type:complete len:513 (-) Transcript_14676:159-1697(-)|eukprot:CAMPEP_0119131658 /NCGR_PEP_ID=MMETSP1310-20130426/10507_1 /TAXON_ID=464262 /ORGANISM="Genus nov. species nov., Strain RCC2339" /LENGTH=512 /DNA_ID=CAMNT_0007122249 /DNA_START=70 /DNA_END=1608 /DNA_ORIENTATION=-